MKVFVTGGSGYLGKELVKYISLGADVFAPSNTFCNILDEQKLNKVISIFKPDCIIHLAAFVDTFGCENDIKKAIDVNVIGSEYVFSGDKGNYTINDRLDPINVYGKTKAAAEYIASTAPNHQIIRAPFIRQIYPKVFTDQYCSRYFLKDAVGKIINNIFKNEEKIIHISSERMSLYDLYIKNGLVAEPITMSKEQKKTLPKDTSLINNSI